MRVLVIDDNADIRHLLRSILQTDGHEVIEAGDGLEALQILEAEHETLSVVLLDVQMPDMTGWDVLRQIRFHAPMSDLPVVMCTVKSGEADFETAGRLECDGYVTKPFDPVELLATVAKAGAKRSPA